MSYTMSRFIGGIMELRGSQTEKNLWTALAGESQATNKYTAVQQALSY